MSIVNGVDRSGKIFNLIQIFNNYRKFVFSVNVINWIVQILERMNCLFYSFKCMPELFYISHRTCKIFERIHFLLQFIKMVASIHIIPHRIGHKFDSVKLFANILKAVISKNIINWIV